MKDRLSRKGSTLLDMMSQRRRLAKDADPEAHRRSGPDRDSLLPHNHTPTPIPPMGPFTS
jgi:hypothetical protein